MDAVDLKIQRNRRDVLDAAINYAARASDFSHLVRVASRFCGTDDVGMAAWLHDTIEDGYASETELRDKFPDRVIDIVMIVTKKNNESYSSYIDRVIASQDSDAIDIKIADVQVNLNRAKVDRYFKVPRYEETLGKLYTARTMMS